MTKKTTSDFDMRSQLLCNNRSSVSPNAAEHLRFFDEQETALAALRVPTRRTEAWRSFCWSRFKPDERELHIEKPNEDKPEWASQMPSRSGMRQLVFVNGVLNLSLSDLETPWPEGVEFELWGTHRVTSNGLESLQAFFETADYWEKLSQLTSTHGFFLRVDAGVTLKQPIRILHVTTASANTFLAPLHQHIVLGEAASCDVFFDYWSPDGNASAWINQSQFLDLQAGSSCRFSAVYQEAGVQRLVNTQVKQAQDSQLDWQIMGLQTDWFREALTVHSLGENTESQIRGMLLPSGRESMFMHTLLKHHAPNTAAHQCVRSVVTDRAESFYQGRVYVAEGALKTESTQENKSILIGSGAKASSQPQLEIYADDVICSHGATIGQLDPDALFYLRSRGLTQALAKRVLIHGFIESLIHECEHFRSELNATLEAYWAKQTK